jgi:hypothetical protein
MAKKHAAQRGSLNVMSNASSQLVFIPFSTVRRHWNIRVRNACKKAEVQRGCGAPKALA